MLASGNVAKLDHSLIIKLNAANYRTRSIFRRMSQFTREMGSFCCAKAVKTISQMDDFFGSRSIRVGPICRVFCFAN